MDWKTKLTSSLLMAVLLQSCASNESQRDLNESALYDPPTLTMVNGMRYTFVEGVITGRGQKWHSEYSYRRAIIIGTK